MADKTGASAEGRSSNTLVTSAGALQRVRALREEFRVSAPIRPSNPLPGDPAAARPSSSTPVIAEDVASGFETIDDGHVRPLVLAPRNAPVSIALPTRADRFADLGAPDAAVAIAFALRGASDAPLETAGGIALYPHAFAGSDLIHRATAEGTEDFVVFEERPAHEELSYDVDVSRVRGLRLVGNTLEFLDGTGAPRLRIAPPSVVDRAGAHAATLSVEGCAFDRSPAPPWGRPVTSTGASSCVVRVAWRGVDYPAIVDPSWTLTGSMAVGRTDHTASRLGSGAVLVAGGIATSGGYTSSAELYDPTSGTFATTGSLAAGRGYHTASVLASGAVLVAGGHGTSAVLASAELYDPTAGTFSTTGAMPTPRWRHGATVLGSGNVLVTGGVDAAPLATAVLYNPTTAAFASTGAMASARYAHTSTLSSSGALIAGGENSAGALSTTELYSATAGTFSSGGTMTAPRAFHVAVVLPSGNTLLAGGYDGSAVLASAEILSSGFSATGLMASPRESFAASVLPDGKVLVAGGFDGTNALSEAEIFDPLLKTFSAAGAMNVARIADTATLLASGDVLVVGGDAPAELFHRAANGGACLADGDCLSGICDANGICCTATCTGVCRQCEQGTGACVTVTNGVDVDTCFGTSACSAAGSCKSALGQGCANGVDCASGFCSDDGVCCNTACNAGPCDACSIGAGADADGTCKLLTGPACDDGSACTQGDTCQAGVCVGGAAVQCPASDSCHDVGACNPANGLCSNPAKPDDAPCDDGNGCTQTDLCKTGVCIGGNPISCPAQDVCHDPGVCDALTGVCSNPIKPDGTSCPGGTCQGGVCTGSSTMSSSSSSASSSSTSSSASTSASGTGGAGGSTSASGEGGASSPGGAEDSGCGCSVPGSADQRRPLDDIGAAVVLSALLARRRRRRHDRRGSQ